MRVSLGKAAIIVVLLLAIVGVLYFKGQQGRDEQRHTATTPTTTASTADAPTPHPDTTAVAAPVPAKKSSATSATARVPHATAATKSSTPSPHPSAPTTPTPPKPTSAKLSTTAAVPAKPTALPRLIEFGADKCVPCRMMQPVLAELRKEYAGKLQVDFIDVWKDPAAGEQYAVQGIPTQIFFDAEGKELFRHNGFYPKEDIVAKFAELGISL